jgi:hypothetical protein
MRLDGVGCSFGSEKGNLEVSFAEGNEHMFLKVEFKKRRLLFGSEWRELEVCFGKINDHAYLKVKCS